MSRNQLLSIVIPTYNREQELKKGLKHLLEEYNQLPKKYQEGLDIFVSDNASDYNFETLLKRYEGLLPISYNINKENIGPIKNFELCLERGSAQYVWLLSDDDYPAKGALFDIFETIESSKPDLLFLNFTSHKFASQPLSDEKMIILDNCNDFIRHTGIKPTLTSSIIIDRKYIDIENNPFRNTFLPHFYFTLDAACKGSKLVAINSVVLDWISSNEVGGYNLFTVFGVEMYDILDFFINNGCAKKTVVDETKKRVFRELLMTKLLQLKLEGKDDKRFEFSSIHTAFMTIFKKNYQFAIFWIYAPLIYILPSFLLRALEKIHKMSSKK